MKLINILTYLLEVLGFYQSTYKETNVRYEHLVHQIFTKIRILFKKYCYCTTTNFYY